MNNRIIPHVFLENRFNIDNKKFEEKRFSVIINRPGNLKVFVKGVGRYINPEYGTETGGHGHHGNTKPFSEIEILFKIKLLDPLGMEFKKLIISNADLNSYKNNRGILDKPWKVVITSSFKGGPFYKSGYCEFFVKVDEIVTSSSAPPLISEEITINNQKEYLIDLYRIGNLRVHISKKMLALNVPDTQAVISLEDPDGKLFVRNSNGSFTIRMADLKPSRKSGKVQLWKLIIKTNTTGKRKVFAQVYDAVVIPKELILDRLEYLLGKNGEHVELAAEWVGGELLNRFTLKPKTKVLAENIEIHGLIKKINPDAKYDSIEANQVYTIREKRFFYEFDKPYTWAVSADIKFHDFKITGIKIAIDESVKRDNWLLQAQKPDLSFEVNTTFPFLHFDLDVADLQKITIPAGLPSLKIEISTSGYIDLINNNLPNIEDIYIPKIEIEIVFDEKDKGITCYSWINVSINGHFLITDVVDIADSLVTGKKINSLEFLINSFFKGFFLRKIDKILSDFLNESLGHMLGGIFDITDIKWNGNSNSIEIEYIPDILTERKPNPKYNHKVGNNNPPNMHVRASWDSPQLTADPNKIKHIVVLMMENRSFDHVLGYLSLPQTKGAPPNQVIVKPAINNDVNGLTPNVVSTFSDKVNMVQHLKNAKFKASTGDIKTKIPIGVGHHYTDALEQIDGGTMKGFVRNFEKGQPNELRKDANGKTRTGTEPQDVLGYYTDADLKMYKYLADNFMICDDYYSSHPGPTLPNRMYSLSGDLQKDRNGEPKLENSVDTSFMLSREINIFDILDQESVSWRVYESFPSVTMLRMFTRYAGDNKRILNIDQLEADIKNSRVGTKSEFPSVVFIDPAMHDAPCNDDHPPADMLYGQHLIKNVYDALRNNTEVWNHTLFIINYDEHGGLFDHVPPKLAEVYAPKLDDVIKETSTRPLSQKKVSIRETAMRPKSQEMVSVRETGNSTLSDEKVDVIYGVRVPCFIVSPYVEPGSVNHTTLDHTSVLKTILVRFCGNSKPFLSDRVHAANNLGGALKSPLRRDIPASCKDIPCPDDDKNCKDADKKKSLERMAKSIKENFVPMTKSKLSSEDVDFHEFLAFLGRTVKPIK